MLFSSFKNLVSFFRQSDRGLTKSNISNQFCKPVVGLCALLCMSLWISAAQAQQQMRTNLAFLTLYLLPIQTQMAMRLWQRMIPTLMILNEQMVVQ